jgi:uncharacterized Zn finger protein
MTDLFDGILEPESINPDKTYACQCCNSEGKTVVWDNERQLYSCTACGKVNWGHTKKIKEELRNAGKK